MKLNRAVMILVGMAAIHAFPFGAHDAVSAQQTQSVWDGVYTEAQAMRGEPLYAQECAACHGPDLEGGEMAPGLSGGEFVWNWNGLSMGDLFERVRVSMPQDNPGKVSRQQKADILAFMLLRNEFPVGETELATRTERLSRILFEALKP